MKIQTARQRLLASTMIGGALLAVSAIPAAAQDDQATELDAVVVTGSRIVRQDFEAISPVTTVGSEQLELTATVSVESLLNELPQVLPGNMRTSNNSGGESFATLDLRGLGPQRTLILVNGERVPASSTTGVVDINTIPASLISRVEVVTGGASAVYGSDAVSGVINFILKDDFEGAEVAATYGGNFDGLANEFEINGLFGGNFDNGRGNLTAYGAYYERDGVFQSELDYSRNSSTVIIDGSGDLQVVDSAAEFLSFVNSGNFFGTFASGGSNTPPWGTVYNNPLNPFGPGTAAAVTATGNTNFLAGNYDTNCDGTPNATPYAGGANLSFDANGDLIPRRTAGACATADRAAGSDRYNFAPDNYLIIPAERFTIATIGHYDITDSIRLDVRMSYVNSTSTVSLAPTPATALTVNLTPAMIDLISTNHPDLFAALNSRTDPTAPFTMDRRTNEVGRRVGESENNALSMLATLTGDFGDFIPWDWSLTASYGVNNYLDSQFNSVNKTAFFQGLSGCQDPTSGAPLGVNALPGCVPLDIFGENTLTDAMVSFLTVPTFAETEIEESRIAGFTRGDLFQLPAGPVAAVFGFEYRDTSANFFVDDQQRTGNIYGFNAIQNQIGSVDVMELYTEVVVPILADMPFADYLGLEAGYRYSDYSSVGELETYKIGGEYAPWSWLRFRGMYNVAARAPSVFELFQNGDQGFPAYTDPCNDNLGRTADELALCQAQAPIVDFTGFQQVNAQVEAFAFGNPNLTQEEAESITFGAVFQPDTFPVGDLRVSVDYYDIEITDVISSLGAGFFLSQCFGGGATGGIGSDACNRIVRDQATGQVDFINTTRTNLGSQETQGVDVQAEWSYNLDEVGLPGTLRLNNLFSYVDSYQIDGTEFAGLSFASIGGAIFDYKNVLSAYYSVGDWTTFVRWSYVPEMEDGNFGGNFFTGEPTIQPDASYVDASVRWDVTDSLQLTAFVGNIFDEDTPQTTAGYFGQANTDVQVYRPLGRTFAVSAKARF